MAGGEDREARTRLQQCGKLGSSAEDAFAVVEHQEQVLVSEGVDQSLEAALAPCFKHPEGTCHDGNDQ